MFHVDIGLSNARYTTPGTPRRVHHTNNYILQQMELDVAKKYFTKHLYLDLEIELLNEILILRAMSFEVS